MAINFPNTPQINDVYAEGNRAWRWNGTYWKAISVTIGYSGSQGYTGSQGDLGFTGSRGDDGTSVKIVGGVTDSSQLPTPYNGDIGDGYISQDNGHLWIWNGSIWEDVGQIIGYTGSAGFTGSRGEGFTGSQGDTGFVGSRGDTGFSGSRGSLETWTKITANYTAGNNQRLIADTSGGQFTVLLPSNPTTGFYVVITDGGDWGATPLLVDGNGNTVEGYSDPISLDIADITCEFIWNTNNWEVTATLGVQGVTGYVGSQGIPGEFAALGYTGSQANLDAVGQSIIPDSDEVYDLGSATYKWRNLYVSSNTIFLGTSSLSVDEVNNQLVLTNAQGEPIEIGGASVEVSATAPADPSDGNMWLDSTTGNFSVYVGGGWLKIGPGGGGSASVEVSNSSPSSPEDGNMWMNDETGEFSIYVGGAWLSISGGSGPAGYTGSQGASGELITWAAAQTANFTATANLNYIVDTTNNAVTVTLPSSPQYGDQIKIADGGGNATANNITITSPNNIMGTGDDFLLDLNWSAVQFTYYNATKGWIITGTS